MDYAIVKKILLDCFKWDSEDYPRAAVLTVAHDNDRSLLHNGKYYSPLVDTMEDDLAKAGIECVSVARIISTIKGDLAYGKVYSPEGRFARALVQKRLLGLLRRGPYPYSRLEESAWGSVLDKTGARKVFGIQPSRELCMACHKRGVWVADVQHGVIADSHPWYGQQFRGSDPAEFLPSAFLCWDRGSEEVIGKWARSKGVATQVIGNRWLARFVAGAPGDTLVQDLAADYERATPRHDSRKAILVSLSWGEVSIPNGFIDEGLEAVIRKTANRFRWLIRLHPNQIKGFASNEGPKFIDYFNSRLSGCAEWELPTRAPLPVVLNGIDLHVSWHSSVSMEAAQMGVKSALLNPQLRRSETNATAGRLAGTPGLGEAAGDYYRLQRQAGLIEFIAETESSILSWIDRNLESRRTAETFEGYDAEYRKLLDYLST